MSRPVADDLQKFAVSNNVFVTEVEGYFDELINSPKLMSFTCPAMGIYQREVVHELAKYYSCESVSVGSEPNRRVVISKTGFTRRPTVLLSKWRAFQRILERNAAGSTARTDQTPNAIHFFGLTAAIKTKDIMGWVQVRVFLFFFLFFFVVVVGGGHGVSGGHGWCVYILGGGYKNVVVLLLVLRHRLHQTLTSLA